MISLTIPFAVLKTDTSEIFRNMGMDCAVAGTEITTLVSLMMQELSGVCLPRYSYTLLPVTDRDVSGISVSGIRFKMGRVITRFFAEATYCAVFTATAGEEFDHWCHDERISKEIVQAFVADSIGSEIAEAAARQLMTDLTVECEGYGMKTGNSYSPGYCGWDVAEQHQLFGLLPSCPCGITLNESGLMKPVKSVSGFIPVGHNVARMPYGCEICKRPDCYKNRHTQKQY